MWKLEESKNSFIQGRKEPENKSNLNDMMYVSLSVTAYLLCMEGAMQAEEKKARGE